MRAGGGAAARAARGTCHPDERNQQDQDDRRGVEKIERRKREGLLRHQAIEEREGRSEADFQERLRLWAW